MLLPKAALSFARCPFQHLIHYGYHIPEDAELTEKDFVALVKNPVGLLGPAARLKEGAEVEVIVAVIWVLL